MRSPRRNLSPLTGPAPYRKAQPPCPVPQRPSGSETTPSSVTNWMTMTSPMWGVLPVVACHLVLTGGAGQTHRRAAGGLPRRVARALLPPGRLRRRGGGPGAGNAVAGLAGGRQLRRGQGFGAYVVVPHRDERVPD